MTKTESIRLIDKAYAELAYQVGEREARGWNAYIDQIKREEKDHRGTWSVGFAGNTKQNGLTLAQSVRLFALRTIVQYLEGDSLDAKDYLHIRTSHYFAYALATEYGVSVRKALDKFNLAEILALDYAELNKAA